MCILNMVILILMFSEINECDSMPCQNDGHCLDQHLDVICICKPGFKGKYCELGKYSMASANGYIYMHEFLLYTK